MIVLAGFSVGLQAVTASVLILVLYSAVSQRPDPASAIPYSLMALIPLLAQGLICWIKNEPIIHVASLVASCAILAVILHDVLVPTYFPLGVLAPWPIVFLVMICGNVIAWITEFRHQRKGTPSGEER